MSLRPEWMEAVRESFRQPEKLTELEDIKRALIFVRKLTDKPIDEATIESIAVEYHQQISEGRCQFLLIKNEAGELVAASCVQNINCLPGFAEEYGLDNAYLRDQAVNPEFQGKKNSKGNSLAKEISDACFAGAREMGCDKYMFAEIDLTNFKSLISKFKDGFVATRFEKYDEDPQQGGCLLVRKRIDGEEEFDKKNGSLGELKEISLNKLGEIFDLMEKEGYVAVDIKNQGDIKNVDPENWSLVLEKS